MIFRRNKQESKSKIKKESRLRIDRDEEVTEGEVVETEWDIKKLVAGIVVLVLMVIVGAYIFFPSSETQSSTLGVGTQNLSPTPPLPNKEDVQNVLNQARETLSKITSENLTSSQAALQDVINNLETLKGKDGALEVVCNMMCKK